VRLHRQAGIATYPDDYPDNVFFGYNCTGYSDDEGEESPPLRDPTPPGPAESTSVVEAEAAEAVVVEEEPKPKRRTVKGTTKTRSHTKLKPFRRECSRPEA